jgi:hypothetical protein
MTADASDEGPRPGATQRHDEATRRRRRTEVFGDVLPETTADDLDTDGAANPGGSGDDWLRSQVPPHHG